MVVEILITLSLTKKICYIYLIAQQFQIYIIKI